LINWYFAAFDQGKRSEQRVSEAREVGKRIVLKLKVSTDISFSVIDSELKKLA